ncbi:MAG: ribose-5-phosphate isomerase RpiA [Candidatus Cybelea sp.]
MNDSPRVDLGKRAVGYAAVDQFVEDGTCIGLGTGTTTYWAIERVAQRVAAGERITAVATSEQTASLCRLWNIPLVGLLEHEMPVAIDGADEVALDWALIKGGGGALFREKAVALVAARFVVVVTPPKLVSVLGAFPLPVEIVPFAERYVVREISRWNPNVEIARRGGDVPFVSDNGNWILDCHFGRIEEPGTLDVALRAIHGVVATGIFVAIADVVMVGDENGEVRSLPAYDAHLRLP